MNAIVEFDFAEELIDDAEPPNLLELFDGGRLHCRPDITNEAYHADRSCVSTSGLKEVLRSPAHYQAYLNGNRRETNAMAMGSAVHARLLEPDLFFSEYRCAPVSDKRTCEWKDFEAFHSDMKLLTPEQWVAIEGIAHSVDQHLYASSLLSAGLVEHTLIWQDKETGIWLKIRPDCLCLDFGGMCVDVKKTVDASEAGFYRACRKYLYDLQVAVYLEGLRINFQRDFDFLFLCVEEQAPHGCALYGAPLDMIEEGHQKFRQALRTIAACRDSGKWPGYQPAGDYSILRWSRRSRPF